MAQGAARVRLGADERRDGEGREGQQDRQSHDCGCRDVLRPASPTLRQEHAGAGASGRRQDRDRGERAEGFVGLAAQWGSHEGAGLRQCRRHGDEGACARRDLPEV